MSTKTPREKIHELIKQNYNENTARCVVALVMPVFDAILEEARQEMKEKCLKCIPRITPNPFDSKEQAEKDLILQDNNASIIKSIKSL